MQEEWLKSRAHRKEVTWGFRVKETEVLKVNLFSVEELKKRSLFLQGTPTEGWVEEEVELRRYVC